MRNNKKGIIGMVLVLIGFFIVIAIVIPGIKVWGNSIEKFGSPNINSSYKGIRADNISIVIDPALKDNPCTYAGSNEYRCKTTQTANFEINITNEGDRQYSLSGGIIICNSRNVDEDCLVVTGTELCSITNDGKPHGCGAGAYMFNDDSYFIYPLVICPMDKKTGCADPSAPSTLSEIRIPPDEKTYIKVQGIITK